MERVLLVAGSQKGQDVLTECLSGLAPFEICCVRTGGEAWREITDHSFSLVVILSPLPDGNGYDLAKMAAGTTAGVLLLAAVLFIPGLERLFLVSAMSIRNLACILLLAIAPTVLIQVSRLIQGK